MAFVVGHFGDIRSFVVLLCSCLAENAHSSLSAHACVCVCVYELQLVCFCRLCVNARTLEIYNKPCPSTWLLTESACHATRGKTRRHDTRRQETEEAAAGGGAGTRHTAHGTQTQDTSRQRHNKADNCRHCATSDCDKQRSAAHRKATHNAAFRLGGSTNPLPSLLSPFPLLSLHTSRTPLSFLIMLIYIQFSLSK